MVSIMTRAPRLLGRAKWDRLRTGLPLSADEATARLRHGQAGDIESTVEWYQRHSALRATAVARAEDHDLNGAWTALKAASRELLWAYDDAELAQEAARVRAEASDKLRGWRRTCIIEAIDDAAPQPSLRTVLECRRVLDDGLDNSYLKSAMLRERLAVSSVSLFVGLVLVFAFAGVVGDPEPNLLANVPSALLVGSLGAVGATLSALFSLRDQELVARIPDLQQSWLLIPLRPLIGAASALVMVLILQSGVAGLQLDSRAALAAAVGAGFSERWATRAVTTASEAMLPSSTPPQAPPSGSAPNR